MIKTISGRITGIKTQEIVLDIGGIGVGVYLPTPILQTQKIGEPIFLYTSLIVREDSLTLYGFEKEEERDIFELLLGVSGVGPRIGLAILSILNPDAIRRGVLQNQPEIFRQVPGIGKKTAQKILLHLEDRVEAIEGLETVIGISDKDTEVLEALVALGYSVVEAQTAVQSIPRDAPPDVETRLTLALAYFS